MLAREMAPMLMRMCPARCCWQDYVKWRGQLFHQFLRALVDDSAEVRAMAEFLLADTICNKVPTCVSATAVFTCQPLIAHCLHTVTLSCTPLQVTFASGRR